jgi:hypothetical protein
VSGEELLAAFEAATLPPERFDHAAHVRVAWLLLRRFPALEAAARFRESLQRYATALGKTGLYHETITLAYLFLIGERIARAPAATWEEFAAANPDLLRWRPSVLDGYYRPDTLGSELARRAFVLPDLALHAS